MYRIINQKNFRNLSELRIRPMNFEKIKVGDTITIVRSRFNLEDHSTDYSMDTDCEVTQINGSTLVLDNHKESHNIVYYSILSDFMKSVSKTHRYNQFLVRGEIDIDKYLDKNLYYVMLHGSYHLHDIVTNCYKEIPVFADSEQDAIEIIKSEADISFNFEYCNRKNFVRRVN